MSAKKMNVLVINAGSSSIKYQVIDMESESLLGKGMVERIGCKGSNLRQVNQIGLEITFKQDMNSHLEAFKYALAAIVDPEKGILKSYDEIFAIGHRVVHSGEDFNTSVYVTDTVLEICKKNIPLAKLHMPANITGIESCISILPQVPNVAVFDTVFHSTMPNYANMYAIDYQDYEKYKIRRYGFHGTSHQFVTNEAINFLGNPEHSKIITCHLGNGSSIAAVKDGQCIDTTMGFTPLEGLVMGTRSGDIDPSIITFLSEKKNKSPKEILDYLNEKCGFLGLTGVSDLRDVAALYNSGDERARLAALLFAYRIKKYIGSYYVALGGLDCIALTGGIGENSRFARGLICDGLQCLGVKLDSKKNVKLEENTILDMQADDSQVKILAIRTNEELMIARDTKKIIYSML